MSAEIVIDLAALKHNIRTLTATVGVPVMTVVKADGYGHGMVQVARAAREAGSPWLGVATPDEAVALRDAGDTGRLLCWLSTLADDFAPALERDVDVSAYDIATLERIAAAGVATGTRPRVHLKVDTGLSRGGSMPAQWRELFQHAKAGHDAGRWAFTGIFSHFATSEEPDNPSNAAQEAIFREALAVLDEIGLTPEVRHLANSAGAVLRPSARFDLVRIGIAAYGLDPSAGLMADLDLRPVMSVRTQLALVKQIPAGTAVSYGGHWRAPEATWVGLVPVGYGEGISRSAANRGEVWIAGKRRPIRGSICMDQFVVDLGPDGADLAPGESVIVLGAGDDGEPTATDWADYTGTIHYEVVTRLGGRLVRRHVDTTVDTTEEI